MKSVSRLFLMLSAGVVLSLCKKNGVVNDTEIGGLQPLPKKLVISRLASNLQIPWGLAILPNGDLIYGERYGKLYLIKKNDTISKFITQRPIIAKGEAGLLSIAVDPSYNTNHFIYAFECLDSSRIFRLKWENDVLSEDKIIFRGIPVANNHDGGALKFGPDGYLYIGTGDALQPNNAQDKHSLAGKILRIDRDGNIPPGNPFNSAVWTYGHRNVQGFSWTSKGNMLATEHGPSLEFNWCCHDEINLIEKGKNYGWPVALGGTEKDTLTPPIIQSGDYDTWAPSGCTYLGNNSIWKNCLLVGALRGEKLIRFYLNADEKTISKQSDTLQNVFHRIRNVIETPDGSIIFSTSNYGINPLPAGHDVVNKLSLK